MPRCDAQSSLLEVPALALLQIDSSADWRHPVALQQQGGCSHSQAQEKGGGEGHLEVLRRILRSAGRVGRPAHDPRGKRSGPRTSPEQGTGFPPSVLLLRSRPNNSKTQKFYFTLRGGST